MKLIFVKRDGRHDALTIVRAGLPDERIACPAQGILPHDMVHHAVESVLPHRGFLTRLRAGEAALFGTGGGDDEEAVERLVEAFQAEMWGGRVPAAELIDTYVQGCQARGHGAPPVSIAEVAAVRLRIDELTARWSALPVNGTLTLDF